jgi:hypothetical protein
MRLDWNSFTLAYSRPNATTRSWWAKGRHREAFG